MIGTIYCTYLCLHIIRKNCQIKLQYQTVHIFLTQIFLTEKGFYLTCQLICLIKLQLIIIHTRHYKTCINLYMMTFLQKIKTHTYSVFFLIIKLYIYHTERSYLFLWSLLYSHSPILLYMTFLTKNNLTAINWNYILLKYIN